MKQIIFILFITLLMCSCASTEVQEEHIQDMNRINAKDIGRSIEIVSSLGVPIGKEIIISGEKSSNKYSNWMWVDAVDGVKLDSRKGILVDGIGKWNDGTRITLKGYEYGKISYRGFGSGIADQTLLDYRPKHFTQYIYLSFYVQEILEPKSLKLEVR